MVIMTTGGMVIKTAEGEVNKKTGINLTKEGKYNPKGRTENRRVEILIISE